MARLRQNFQAGSITNNPLLIAGTTLNSPALADLVAVTGSDYLVVVLDPNAVAGDPEIVYVTAHTAAATSATISRGEEGSVAREHLVNTAWEHNITADDFDYDDLSGLPSLAGLKSVTSIAQGTVTYNTPAGITAILVQCQGAGGGGGGAGTAAVSAAGGAGGAGGGFAQKLILSPASSYTVAVGAGGTAGAATPTNGGNGGNTTFDSPSVCTAIGGNGGAAMVAGTTPLFSSGGQCVTGAEVGDLVLRGQPGGPGQRVSGTMAVAGFGGMGARGGAGARGRIDAGAGEAVGTFGGGGAGGLVLNGSAAVAGSAGADGRIVVLEFGD